MTERKVVPMFAGTDIGGNEMARKASQVRGVLVPPPPVDTRRDVDPRGKSLTIWLPPEDKQALDEMLSSVGLSQKLYMQWLVTLAISKRMVPPGYESRLRKEK